jgi:hypothetical protein
MRTLLGALIVSASLFTLYTMTRSSYAHVDPTRSVDLDVLLDEALAENPHVSARRNTEYRLTGSIVSGERGTENGLRSYRCEVSLILTERKTGSVRAFLSGRASGSGPHLEELEPKVLRTAIRGALRRLDALELAR